MNLPIRLNYHVGCRNCLKSNNINHIYNVQNADIVEYKIKTEYEVIKQIEEWREEDGHLCSFCSSPNVEIYNVVAQDYEEEYKLYDYEQLDYSRNIQNSEMWMLNIDKRENIVNLSEGGKIEQNKDFIKSCITELFSTLNSIPTEKFVSHNRGVFFVCFTGKYSNEPDVRYPLIGDYLIKLQRFIYHGINREEITNKIIEKYNPFNIM